MTTDLGVSKRVIAVGGIWVNVFSRSESSSLPPAILFFLHGRQQSAEQYESECHKLFSTLHSLANGLRPSKNLIVVTLDQRNHGTRLIDGHLNNIWELSNPADHNENHAIDMYAIQMGTARDVSYLIDFLPAYLFPRGVPGFEGDIEWLVAGISLGGHASWIVLRNDPRVKVGIPVIGCADYLKLMKVRAEQAGVELQSPVFPEHMLTLIAQYDPASAPHQAVRGNPFLDKKILVLSGGKDQLVPFEPTREFFEKLHVGDRGVKAIVIEPEAGHQYTELMHSALCRFVWEHSLSQGRTPGPG